MKNYGDLTTSRDKGLIYNIWYDWAEFTVFDTETIQKTEDKFMGNLIKKTKGSVQKMESVLENNDVLGLYSQAKPYVFVCRSARKMKRQLWNMNGSLTFTENNSSNWGKHWFLRVTTLNHVSANIQLRKYSPNSRCRRSSCLLAVPGMFLGFISPSSYSWNDCNVRHFCFHNQNNSRLTVH